MLDMEIKNIYILQSRNVRYLKKIQKNLTMDINKCLIKKDLFQLHVKTKYYAMLYRLVSESQFVQILYTPNGFRYSEIVEIKKIIDEYIKKPQELRNKIAHGQWIHALNSENTKENIDTTKRIENLDVVQISIWFEVHQYLCFIIRDLIQSPKKGFHNNYWSNLVELEKFLSKSKSWTLDKRIAVLDMKKPKNK